MSFKLTCAEGKPSGTLEAHSNIEVEEKRADGQEKNPKALTQGSPGKYLCKSLYGPIQLTNETMQT